MKKRHLFTVCCTMFILIISVCALAYPVPDTGQTKCYNDSEEINPCPQPGDDFYGQDANYTINPPSYTKLNDKGEELPDSAEEWCMVRDNVTGLIWEVKEARDGQLDYSNSSDADNTYTWYDSNSEANGGYAGTPGDGTDTEDFIDDLNSEEFGGFSDWRLPTIKELNSIVYYGNSNNDPRINTKYFPNRSTYIYYSTCNGLCYWSSTTATYYEHKSSARYVNFDYNGLDEGLHNTHKSSKLYVHAVRGKQNQSSGHFIINDNDTVTDTNTGLMWQRQKSDSGMNWKDAITYCEDIDLGGYNDWRLPTIKELESILNYDKFSPSIDEEYFPGTVSAYWSSTNAFLSEEIAWRVDFGQGGIVSPYYSSFKSGKNYIRAVRGGQNQSEGHLFISEPAQASTWDLGSPMSIRWNPQDIPGNVRISLCRKGGKEGTFETIVESTENDGHYVWEKVMGNKSDNCMIKIEPLNEEYKSRGTTQGLFSLTTELPMAVVSGEPEAPTDQTEVTLTVGGEISHYKYRLNDGTYSGERQISEEIELTNLPDGRHTVYILGGRNDPITWQTEDNPTTASWTLDTTPPEITITDPQDNSETELLSIIQGTASDTLSGVSGVELEIEITGKGIFLVDEFGKLSFDSDQAWLPANGTDSWSFVTSSVNGWSYDSYKIKAKATDAAGNNAENSVVVTVWGKREPSEITCELSESSIILGEPLRISGKITPKPNSAATGVNIQLGEAIKMPATANEDGEFEHVLDCDDIQSAGTWIVKTNWNGDDKLCSSSSEEQTFEVRKASSSVSLDVTSQSIKNGDEVSISGRFITTPRCDKIPPDTYINLNILHADGIKKENIKVQIKDRGYFKKEGYTGFNALGEWEVQAVFEEHEAYEGSSSEILKVKVKETAGYAIIVQGKIDSEEGLDSHKKTTDFVYDTLKNRGLSKDDIRYFNYDTDDESSEKPLHSAIQDAITGWAKDMMNEKPANLYIVMVNHGLREQFYIDDNDGEIIIKPGELDTWLDNLEDGLTEQASNQEIIIILGFCHSGSFMDELQSDKKNRIVIASAASEESSYKGPLDEDNIREGEYFVSEFFKSVSLGNSVSQCFQKATALTEIFTSSDSGNSYAPYYDNSRQHPLLDDNGDGIGSNDLTIWKGDGSLERDGLLSDDIIIGVSSITANDPGDVRVTRVKEPQFLEHNETSLTLWAKVDNEDDVSTIWCEKKPPNYIPPMNSHESGQIEMELNKKLYDTTPGSSEKPDTLPEDSYGFIWKDKEFDEEFSEPGTYQIFFFAKDAYTGNVSPLRETKVYKGKENNNPPEPFSLKFPEDGETTSTTPILDWEDTTDPDGDKMSYRILISKVPFDDEKDNPDGTIYKEEEMCSISLVEDSDDLDDQTYYYWKVQAIDEYGATQESDVRMFRTDNEENPVDAFIGGHVYEDNGDNSSSYQPVIGATLTLFDIMKEIILPTFSPTDSAGCFLGEVPGEASTLKVEADDYIPIEDWSVGDIFEKGHSKSSEDLRKEEDFKLKKKNADDCDGEQTDKPVFSPEPDTYNSPQDIELLCLSHDDADIYYTTDGSEPTDKSEKYASSIPISEDTTIKARAYSKTGCPSEVAEGEFIIGLPEFSPEPGTYDTPQDIELSCPSDDAVIYYTTDDSEPTEDSDIYSSLVPVSESMTIKFKCKTDQTLSETIPGDYTLKVRSPKFSPDPEEEYDTAQRVKLSCETPDATIRYTTDGNEPNENDIGYEEPFLVSETTTIKAVGYLNEWEKSEIVTETYFIGSPGDITGDNEINLNDAIFTLNILAGKEAPSEVNTEAALNGEKPGLADVIRVLRKLRR
ncbi:DUF1566 domain-containing protein [Desulfococcaceae bacterium HSG8]|nr:DUF1566 domain-containing protein [Desulfococcaceae bacterium HSG8]